MYHIFYLALQKRETKPTENPIVLLKAAVSMQLFYMKSNLRRRWQGGSSSVVNHCYRKQQRTAKPAQCASAFLSSHLGGTWLSLPEETAVNTTVKLIASGVSQDSHFIIQVEADLKHFLNGLGGCIDFPELVCLNWL